MSLNIQVVANKCEFTNEFSEGFEVPPNAQIALTKCRMTTPVYIQNVLFVPLIALADRADTAVYVNIDGIIKGITWTDLFVAWTNYDAGVAIEPTIVADDFFSGNYPFFTNNKVYFSTNPVSINDGDKASISWILSKAINDKFNFYTSVDCSDWESRGIGIGNWDANDPRISLTGVGGHIYNNCSIHIANQKNIKLNVRYNPWATTSDIALNNNYVIGDCTNFTPNPGSLVANALTPSMAVQNQNIVDINGGYYSMQPNWVIGTLRWGFNLNGRAAGLDNIAHDAVIANLNPIDVGLVFTTATTYNIIDGIVQTTTYNGANIENGHQQVLVHQAPMNTYTNNNDYFYMVIQRGNKTTNGTSEYIIKLYQGDNDITDWTTTKPVYTWKRTINSPSIVPTEIFTSNGGLNAINNMTFIQEGEDTEIQKKQMNIWGVGCRDTFSIQPEQDTGIRAIRNFWAALGLHSFNMTPARLPPVLDPLTDYLDSKFVISYDGTPLNKTIEWATDYKSLDDNGTNVSRYWFGVNDLKKYFVYNAIDEPYPPDPLPPGWVPVLNSGWIVNWREQLQSLPSALSVYVNNLTIKNFEGSFNALVETQTQTGCTRLVSTLPVEIGDQSITQDVDINYETYNPYYRPINNPQGFMINQLHVEISFKDKDTDKRKIIKDLEGLVRCEFNIRSGSKPKQDKFTEIIPYI